MPAEPAARPTVWVVDDSPIDAERARRALEGLYQVESLSDGSVALERLAAVPPPDALVLDWVMPGVSGIEVCRYVRAHHRPGLAILLLTAQQQTEQIVEALSAGARGSRRRRQRARAEEATRRSGARSRRRRRPASWRRARRAHG